MFFGDCPAAAGTFARRLTAIDAAHRAAGVAPPERTGQVRDVVRGRPARPVRQDFPADRVAAALRVLAVLPRLDQRLVRPPGPGPAGPGPGGGAVPADRRPHRRRHRARGRRRDRRNPNRSDNPQPGRRSGAVRAVCVGPLAPRPAPRRHQTLHPHPRRGDRPRRRGGRGVAAPVPKPPPHRSGDRGCSAAAADRPPRLSGDRPPAAVPALGVPSGARQHHRSGRGPPRRPANRRRTAATAAARDAGRSTANALRSAIGNRPSHGAAPTRRISAVSTVPWTRRIGRPPT